MVTCQPTSSSGLSCQEGLRVLKPENKTLAIHSQISNFKHMHSFRGGQSGPPYRRAWERGGRMYFGIPNKLFQKYQCFQYGHHWVISRIRWAIAFGGTCHLFFQVRCIEQVHTSGVQFKFKGNPF